MLNVFHYNEDLVHIASNDNFTNMHDILMTSLAEPELTTPQATTDLK